MFRVFLEVVVGRLSALPALTLSSLRVRAILGL
jgi:hypothetical protein